MKKWKYVLVALVALLTLMMCGMALADENEPEVLQVERVPVYQLVQDGTVSAQCVNEFVNGKFYATYMVNYTVTNGVFSVSSCTVEYDYFSGLVKGDLLKPTVSYSVNSRGVLTVTFKFQIKYQKGDVTYYSERMTTTGSVQLRAEP